MIDDEKTQINIRIPRKLLRMIEEDAKLKERATSNQIAFILKEHYGIAIELEKPKSEPCGTDQREAKSS